MHPLKQLKQLLYEASPNYGKVIQTLPGELRISTRTGMLAVPLKSNDATVYRTGDKVILSDGIVVGRQLRQSTVYVL